MLDMNFDGVLDNLEIPREFLIRLSLSEETQYLRFTFGQCYWYFWHLYLAHEVGGGLGRELDLSSGSSFDRSTQFRSLCVFEQVADGTCPHRANHQIAF